MVVHLSGLLDGVPCPTKRRDAQALDLSPCHHAQVVPSLPLRECAPPDPSCLSELGANKVCWLVWRPFKLEAVQKGGGSRVAGLTAESPMSWGEHSLNCFTHPFPVCFP